MITSYVVDATLSLVVAACHLSSFLVVVVTCRRCAMARARVYVASVSVTSTTTTAAPPVRTAP